MILQLQDVHCAFRGHQVPFVYHTLHMHMQYPKKSYSSDPIQLLIVWDKEYFQYNVFQDKLFFVPARHYGHVLQPFHSPQLEKIILLNQYEL